MQSIAPHTNQFKSLFLVRWNNYHCLQLIIADLLLSSGRFIHPDNENYEHTREYSTYSSTIREAAESICSSLPTILSVTSLLNQSQLSAQILFTSQAASAPVMALLVLWPLCCALKVLGIADSHDSWIRATLWDIGSNACIPRASAMVSGMPLLL
jgi:hypothetical protein